VDWNVYAKEQGIEKAKENWLNHAVFSATRKRPEVVDALRPIVADYSGWHWLHSDMQDSTGIPARARLREITKPTLVVVGENDLPYFHNIADILAAEIPKAQKEVMPNAGHMVNMEASAAVNELLAAFIANAASECS